LTIPQAHGATENTWLPYGPWGDFNLWMVPFVNFEDSVTFFGKWNNQDFKDGELSSPAILSTNPANTGTTKNDRFNVTFSMKPTSNGPAAPWLYPFACNLHYGLGMKGWITVNERQVNRFAYPRTPSEIDATLTRLNVASMQVALATVPDWTGLLVPNIGSATHGLTFKNYILNVTKHADGTTQTNYGQRLDSEEVQVLIDYVEVNPGYTPNSVAISNMGTSLLSWLYTETYTDAQAYSGSNPLWTYTHEYFQAPFDPTFVNPGPVNKREVNALVNYTVTFTFIYKDASPLLGASFFLVLLSLFSVLL